MNKDLREQVRQKYAAAITSKKGCCGSGGCCGDNENPITGNIYGSAEVEGLPTELLTTSLGCGNPTALGALHPGETVLDLGSGAGLDVLLSARRVGSWGKAYGLDMTDEMLAAANANKVKSGLTNVEFLKGHIEDIPLPEAAIDVVISNCVINLSVDKDQVFREIHRVLRPGGRIAVSDIVVTRPLPEVVQKSLLAWAGCMAGALAQSEYVAKLSQAGFENIEVVVTRKYEVKDLMKRGSLPDMSDGDLLQLDGALVSAFIRAKKPARQLLQSRDFIIAAAGDEDFPGIHDLLRLSGLTTAGVDPDRGCYYVAKTDRLLGVIGMESYSEDGLVRSFAVAADCRKAGVGKALVEHILLMLQNAGCRDAYLLTDTAADYLEKFGFANIERQSIPEAVLSSSALGATCPSTCVCMSRRL